MRNTPTTFRSTGPFALLAAIIAAPLCAQETVGTISGVVSDEAGGERLPGVTITLKSNATGASQIKVTGANGQFKFPSLTVGSYTLTAQLEGFQTLEETGIMVSVGRDTALSIAMPVGGIEDTITVTSAVPTIDVSSTVSGVTVNTSDFAEKVPVVREPYQIALIAPGTTSGDTAFDSSGSNYTPGQKAPSIGGASVAENTYLVNGLNITNFRNGVGGSNVPFEFVQEVQVKTGGYEAEFGRATGGVLNMVTKSGANRFSGGVNAYFKPESLQEVSPDYFNGFNSEESNEGTEANLYLGGPIWKDKAFFFGFYQYNDIETLAVGITRETVRVRDDPYFGGKVDVNLTASQRLEGTYFTDEVTVTQSDNGIDTSNRGRTGNIGVGTYDAGGDNLVAKYTGIFGGKFVASAQYGENAFNRTSGSTGDNFAYIVDSRGTGSVVLGNSITWNRGLADDEREASRIDFDYFLGSHSLRAGIDDETNTSTDISEYSGGEYYRYYNNGARFPAVPAATQLTRYRIFEGGGTYETLSNAFYAQDSWEVNDELLINLGVRNENFDNKNALDQSFIKIEDQWAPRLGFVYDRNGDGKSKFYGSFGRYHLYIASNTNIRLAGAELFTEDWYVMPSGCDVNNPTFSSCTGQVLQMNVFGDGSVPDVRATKSNQIDPMYQDEISLGYEQQVGKWTLGFRGVYREFGEIIEDITIDAALVAVGLADPGAFEYRLVNPGGDFNGFFDPHDGTPLIPVSFNNSQLGYPAPVREYTAGEFTFYRRFSDNWMLQGSLSLAKSEGNYEGYVRSDNGQDDAGITTLYDFAGLLDNGNGKLPNDRPFNAKVFGGYQMDNGLFFGAAAFYRDGRPLNAFGVHPTDEFSALYGAESFFNQGTPVQRGTVGRTSEVFNMDLSAKYNWDLGDRANLQLRLDAFNIFDQSTVTEVDESADEESGAVNTTYLEATRFQSPRGVRFMVGIDF